MTIPATPLVTLTSPEDAPEAARGAFARLRPESALEPDVARAWRDRVAEVAVAVKVVPATRSAAVAPGAERRAPAGEGYRAAALAIAEDRGDSAVVAIVRSILDEVGA